MSDDPSEATPEQEAVYTMTDLEQLKVVADPLRVKILESLIENEQTTKQVAEALGEKPTRLYHHVDALERVGLIRPTRTRQTRGTVEKYFIAVARAFRADPAIFASGVGESERDALEQLVGTVMTNTTAELQQLVRTGFDLSSCKDGVISFLELRADEAFVQNVLERLMTLLRELEAECCRDRPKQPDDRRYRLQLAYFPLDRDGGSAAPEE